MAMTQATFGGGCFWCLEAAFQEVQGVATIESGYAGGTIEHPTYQQVCQGNTGHAEVIRITFDAEVISYQALLEIFFTIHDPTTLNRQGADRGTQYRSVIFYHNEQQKQQAEAFIRDLEAAKLWDDPVVTQLLPTPDFYIAEAYHQNYYRENPQQGYCQAVINPKLAKLRQQCKSYLK
jgi:peptide-methionine (S)-S-oxide reductase